MNHYLIFFNYEGLTDEWLSTLMTYARKKRIGLVTESLPIIGNLSVLENILLPAQYHHNMSYDAAVRMISADLDKFNLERIKHFRSNQLNDYEKFIVKFLQVKYLEPEWIVFIRPRRMFIAEHEAALHNFLRCEDIEKSVIIDHENHKNLFTDLQGYTEKDFETWATQDLKI